MDKDKKPEMSKKELLDLCQELWDTVNVLYGHFPDKAKAKRLTDQVREKKPGARVFLPGAKIDKSRRPWRLHARMTQEAAEHMHELLVHYRTNYPEYEWTQAVIVEKALKEHHQRTAKRMSHGQKLKPVN